MRTLRLFCALGAAAILGWCVLARAIDNPDAPDLVGSFLERAQQHDRAIREKAGTEQEARAAFAKYEQFLDRELNVAYRAVVSRLDGADRKELVEAQKRWIAFRDAEFKFLASHWTQARHGSSHGVALADHRATLVRDRVVQLLQYAKGMPTP